MCVNEWASQSIMNGAIFISKRKCYLWHTIIVANMTLIFFEANTTKANKCRILFPVWDWMVKLSLEISVLQTHAFFLLCESVQDKYPRQDYIWHCKCFVKMWPQVNYVYFTSFRIFQFTKIQFAMQNNWKCDDSIYFETVHLSWSWEVTTTNHTVR